MGNENRQALEQNHTNIFSMSKRRKIEKWYVADFETTTEEFYLKNGYTKVWLYSICDENEKIVNYGKSIEEFFEFITKNESVLYYFHNLKFDSSYILNYLYKNNYKYIDRPLKVNEEKCFNTLIGEMGEIYEISICINKNTMVKIHDSLKILNDSVEELAKSFDFDIEKGRIDYNINNITEETLDYVFKDVKIVARALKYMKNNGATKMTIGSCSLDLLIQKMKVNYYGVFPKLDSDFLIEWRQAYRGGRSQVNSIHARKILNKVYRYDINSMYAYIQHDMFLPYGEPIPLNVNNINKFRFELYKIKVTFKLKDKHIPSLLKSGHLFTESSYYIESDLNEIIYITSIDFALLKKNYDIFNCEILEAWGFLTSRMFFKEFIDYYYEIKQNNTGAKKVVAKKILVNSYGKFGTKLIKKRKTPKLENNILKFDLTEEEEGKKYYLPVALAITSYAHLLIDNAIEIIGYRNFVYCDTDSVHSLVELPSYMVDNKELGKFKLEAIEEKAKYVRQKCYITYENKEWHITCAGLPKKSVPSIIKYYGDKIIYAFDYGFTIEKDNDKGILPKLRPKQVEGGIILVPTPFRLKE